MFFEHRLIYQQVAPTSMPSAAPSLAATPQTPQMQSSIERALANADVKLKLEQLKAEVSSAQTTEEKMKVVAEMATKDSSEGVIQLANEVLESETAVLNAERTKLTEATTAPTTQEITEQLAVLQQRSELIVQTKKLVLEQENVRLKSEQTFLGGAKTALASLTDAALPEVLTERMSKERKALTAIVGTVGLAVAIPLAFRAAKFAWDHSPLGYLLGKFNKKKAKNTETDEAEAEEEGSGFLKKMLGFTAVTGIAILAGIGISKYVDLNKQLKNAKELLAKGLDKAKNLGADGIALVSNGANNLRDRMNGNEDNPNRTDVSLNTETQTAAKETANEAKEAISNEAVLRAFMFEHRADLGDLERISTDALRTLLASKSIQKIKPEEFLRKDVTSINELLGRTNSEPNQSEKDMFTALKVIVNNVDTSKYETMADFFNDTLMGGITSRVQDVLEGKSLHEIDLAKVAEAALANEVTFEQLMKKPQVASSIERVGLTKEEYAPFITAVFLSQGTSVNDGLVDKKYNDVLQKMRTEVQSDEAIALIQQFGHKKNNANELIGQYVKQGEATHLNAKDTVELFMYLQLMRNEAGTLPTSPKEASPVGAYFMQMKSLDMLSKSNPGEDTMKDVQVYLFNEMLLSSTSVNVNLPPEVIDQMKGLTLKAINTMITKLLELVSVPVQMTEKWFKDLWERNPQLVEGLSYSALIALVTSAGFELDNILKGHFLKKRATMNPGNMHRFGFYDTQNMQLAASNAQAHAELKHVIPRGMFDIAFVALRRTPVYSQMVTNRAIMLDEYYQQRSLASGDHMIIAQHLHENSSTSHINSDVVLELQRIAKISEVKGAGSLGKQDFLENLQTWWNQEGKLGGKFSQFITGVDGIDWGKTKAVQNIIESVKANTLPTINQLTKAGVSATESQKIIDKLTENGIGSTPKTTAEQAAELEQKQQARINDLKNELKKELLQEQALLRQKDQADADAKFAELEAQADASNAELQVQLANAQQSALAAQFQLTELQEQTAKNELEIAQLNAEVDANSVEFQAALTQAQARLEAAEQARIAAEQKLATGTNTAGGNPDLGDGAAVEAALPTPVDGGRAALELSVASMEQVVKNATEQATLNSSIDQTTITQLESIGQNQSLEAVATMRNVLEAKLDTLGSPQANSSIEYRVTAKLLQQVNSLEVTLRTKAIAELESQIAVATGDAKTTLEATRERSAKRLESIQTMDTVGIPSSYQEAVNIGGAEIEPDSDLNDLLDLKQSQDSVVDISRIEESINNPALELEKRIKNLEKYRSEGNLIISDAEMAQVRSAVETGQSIDFIIETNADGKANVSVAVKIK